MMRLIVLRPEPGASATVSRAREAGLEAVAIPLFEIKPVAWEVPEASGFDGLLLTSANAIRHGGDGIEKLRGLRAYAVGEATAEAAREAGFDIAATGESGIDRLLGSIEADLKLLHLCGEDRREPGEARQQITPLAVYKAKAIEEPGLGDLTDAVAIIHSPRAARRFAELVEQRASVSVAAISHAAAQDAGGGWRAVEAADEPSEEALLALATRLCNNPAPK